MLGGGGRTLPEGNGYPNPTTTHEGLQQLSANSALPFIARTLKPECRTSGIPATCHSRNPVQKPDTPIVIRSRFCIRSLRQKPGVVNNGSVCCMSMCRVCWQYYAQRPALLEGSLAIANETGAFMTSVSAGRDQAGSRSWWYIHHHSSAVSAAMRHSALPHRLGSDCQCRQ